MDARVKPGHDKSGVVKVGISGLGIRAMPKFDINDPEHWRQRAQEARAMAAQMNDPISRAMMEGVADDYEKLARRAEERRRKSPAKSD